MKVWKLLVAMTALAAAGCTDVDDSSTASAEEPVVNPVDGKGDSFGEEPDAVWEEIRERCAPPAEDEPVVYGGDFSWGYSLDSMAERYDEIYESGKRLEGRAYYDEESDRFVLPGTDTWGGDMTLPPRLVENVTLHIEHALERGYADFVFFPDMGHAHLFMPTDHWESEYEGVPVSEFSRRYERMFDDPELMVLYHTAEQLETRTEEGELVDDRRVQWRYHTRNVVGDNNYERRIELLVEYESEANTSRDMPGYNYYGAGFNISASKDGCFPFTDEHGETQWYDLSMDDLPYEGGGGFL